MNQQTRNLLKEAAHHLYEHSQEYNHKAPHDLVARIKALLYNWQSSNSYSKTWKGRLLRPQCSTQPGGR
jgi:hypothetical protein